MQINSFPQKPDETGLERKLTFFLCHKYFAQRRKVSKKTLLPQLPYYMFCM